MAIFGLKKSKSSEGSELVLAYLEDLQRVRTPISVVDRNGRGVPGLVTSVTEERVGINLQGPLTVEKGAELSLVFVLEGLRFKATTRLLEAKAGTAGVELPAAIALAERRKKPRARLNAREGATATALMSLFDGVGISGPIENVSEGGVCIRVDRAMEVKTQRKMHLGANLMPVGQELMLVKLSKLPKCPPIELSGRVAYLDASQGLLVGIAFESGKDALLAPIKALVASRAGAIPTAVPPKARRSPEPPREPEEARPVAKKEAPPVREAAPAAEAPAPLPPAPEPPVAAAPVPPPPAPAATAEEPPPPDERSQALLRVKKRTRGILLAMPAGPARDELAAFLTEDGYGRILFADTLTGLLDHLDRPGLHLILVDGGVAEVQGLALASLLRRRMEEEMPPVILAEDSVDAELVVGARQTGVAQILVKPYGLDLDFRRLLEAHLGLG
ncbi:response regulator [Geothrix sp. 21YS21S-4]|uniref:response regulator n=1 Tax=Geothrix sp. 21YS21S-4 TaxID=3068889 RepID=UPI0027BA9D76|nr:response regulator [Geothrix sp. 21YS21S-4]